MNKRWSRLSGSRIPYGVLTLALAGLAVPELASAEGTAGVQVTPEGKRTLISKDVGGQRWAITQNADGTVTGNVFSPVGGPPQFVWCEELGREGGEVRFRCSGGDECPLTPCAPEEWAVISEVSLPESFFEPSPAAAQGAAAGPQTVQGGSGTPSGVQVTPDQTRILISKDVGGQRWAIARNFDDQTVTGNVFDSDGGDPQFVWCEQTGATEEEVSLACSGADRCAATPCPGDSWSFIADVTLPWSFFEPEGQADLDEVTERLIAQFGDDGAFDAVVLALDRGYSLRQVVRAALSSRLGADGQIRTKGGALEATEGDPLGLFTVARVASLDPGERLGDRILLEDFRMGLRKDLFSGEALVFAIVKLAARGYSIDQIAFELIVRGGYAHSGEKDDDDYYLEDADGVRVQPAGCLRGLFTPDVAPLCDPKCNDGVRDVGEDCDQYDFGFSPSSCGERGLGAGRVKCSPECKIDTSPCRPPTGCPLGSNFCTAPDPFPWVFQGTVNRDVALTANFGVHGSANYMATGTIEITLLPDGKVSATYDSSKTFELYCPRTGALAGTIEVVDQHVSGGRGSGQFADGSLWVFSRAITGIYTADRLSGSGHSENTVEASGCDGDVSYTDSTTWSFELDRMR